MTNAIQNVWEFVSPINAGKNNLAIAGGAVTDHFFGKEVRDVDVFAGKSLSKQVEKFCEANGFEEVQLPERTRLEEDSYGDMRRVRVGKQDSPIHTVYKGLVDDTAVDIVVLTDEDVYAHVETKFDLSIKSAWFDGEFNYTKAFMDTVATGVIEPIRLDTGGYVRAWLSADKYNLKLSPSFNLSRDYVTYGYKHNEDLSTILSESTLSKIEGLEDKLFAVTPDRSNVILTDVFMTHEQTNEELYKKLCAIADKKVLAEHPLTEAPIEIAFQSDTSKSFIREISKIALALRNKYAENDSQATILDLADTALNPLQLVMPHQYKEGKIMDEQGRETKIGKYIQKIRRKHKEAYALVDADQFFDAALRELETRSTATKTNVFFTGSKHALTHISTKTKWTSCQRWGGWGQSLGNNYGLLANVSGTTLVAYVADKRADDASSKWEARILVRLGKDGSLLLENTYTNRHEFNRESDLRQAIKEVLEKQGYNVHIEREDALDFVGLPLWSKPYQDVSYMVKTVKKNGEHYLRGYRKEEEDKKRAEAIQEKLKAFVAAQKLDFFKTYPYERSAVLEIPAALKKDLKWLTGQGIYNMQVGERKNLYSGSYDKADREEKWVNRSIYICNHDGKRFLAITEQVDLPYREEERIAKLMRAWDSQAFSVRMIRRNRPRPVQVAFNAVPVPHPVRAEAYAGLNLQGLNADAAPRNPFANPIHVEEDDLPM